MNALIARSLIPVWRRVKMLKEEDEEEVEEESAIIDAAPLWTVTNRSPILSEYQVLLIIETKDPPDIHYQGISFRSSF
jgi:hypothetical protein